LEAEIRKMTVQSQPRQKFCKTSTQPIAGCTVVCTYHPNKLKKQDGSPGQPRQKARPYLQNNQSKKRAGGIAQIIEHLPTKCKDLSSNLYTALKNCLNTYKTQEAQSHHD
jgi:hypothetical protein